MVQKTLKVSGLGLVLKNIQIGNPLPSTLFRFCDLQQTAVSLPSKYILHSIEISSICITFVYKSKSV